MKLIINSEMFLYLSTNFSKIFMKNLINLKTRNERGTASQQTRSFFFRSNTKNANDEPNSQEKYGSS